ncbi:MAG: hypothetical protein B6D55_06055 [Candidatus Omnitrophica bacterium 4484_70.2]|nr:MAG: hypothetical protein B6D55_06055 [Candidatus Omnitrophica bacterium 4484_70.2]
MEEKKEGYMIVTPGTLLATTEKSGEGIYILGGKTYSKYFGILRKSEYKVNVIPFQHFYKPSKGDKVIGMVKEFAYPFFIIDMLSPINGYLHLSSISDYPMKQDKAAKIYVPNTWIYSEIIDVSDRIKLSMKSREAKILKNGSIAYITPSKVPRLIGKGGSMIKMIMEKTNCKVLVGQNGAIWIEGDNINLVIKIIKKIDDESHISGLTDRINEMIDKELKK